MATTKSLNRPIIRDQILKRLRAGPAEFWRELVKIKPRPAGSAGLRVLLTENARNRIWSERAQTDGWSVGQARNAKAPQDEGLASV
jgi:hypothetical protein